MSFDLYFAGSPNLELDKYMMNKGCCRLQSQLNERKRAQLWIDYCKQEQHRKIFIDSGAFTAWSKQKDIDGDEYINFLNTNTNELTLFASVDNIPGELTRKPTLKEQQQSPILSWENYMYMRERIIQKDKLLPVFHIGEDFKYLNNMCNVILDGKHIPYIALGGTVGLDRKTKDTWYNTAFKVIKQSSNPNVKVHAFGMTSIDILEKYPFTSADSTSWLMTAANGNIHTRFGIVNVVEGGRNKPNHISKLPLDAEEIIQRDLWNNSELSIEQCAEDYSMRWIANIDYLYNWADNYQYKGNDRYQKRLF